MNERYFGCRNCKEFTNAGYRWAYWTLEEPHVVEPGQGIDATRVLAALSYWDPPPDEISPQLSALLVAVRAFLGEHSSHEICYGEDHQLFDAAGSEELEWLQKGPDSSPTLRSLMSSHHVFDLKDLERLLGERPDLRPWWWGTFTKKDIERAILEIKVKT